jgi:ABC-type transport system involved in multi-copper enzyme maturation permease subunit
MRWGLGPVFIYECLANSRRWQNYAIRSIGAALLLSAMATIAVSHPTIDPTRAWREYAALGQSYFYAIIGVELTLVMLAAPAATAGAICVDRARGTLTHVLATDLSDPEIVLGKLAARLLPVLGLVACSWPVLALASLLGGIDPTALTLAFAVILVVALLGCTMAMALSVWARKPHEVVLVVYTFWMLVLLVYPIWLVLSHAGVVSPPASWSLELSPYYVAFAPYFAPGRLDPWDYLVLFAATLAASAALVGLASWQMRPVARRGIDEHRKGAGLGPIGRMIRWLPGPSLDGNPVLWREWHRARPSRWLLILIVLIGGSTSVACLIGAHSAWRYGLGTGPPARPGIAAGVAGLMLQVTFGLLMLSAVAPMSMSEERQRGSLDLLAATTLSTPTIVLGKWLGTLRLVALLLVAPALMGFALATADKVPRPIPAGSAPRYYAEISGGALLVGAGLVVATVLVHGALIASVGLALATWMRRQGRAIAFGVGFAVMVGAGWPILIIASRMGPDGQGIASLSPIASVGNLVGNLTNRLRYFLDYHWWTAFWDLECLVLALGLLWLTVRTFDGCFGRMSERPRRATVLSDVVVVLAGLLGAGGFFGLIAQWTKRATGFTSGEGYAISACSFLVAVGFGLVAALAASSMSRGAASPAMSREAGPPPLDRRSAARRWWEAARLVPLLAIGPTLVALSIATGPTPVRVLKKTTPLPGGGRSVIETAPYGDTNVITFDGADKAVEIREATAEEIAAAGVAPPIHTRGVLLTLAAAAVATVLVHGMAFVSLGAALGILIRRRGWAIAASAGLVLFVTVVWPILSAFLGYTTDAAGLPLASVIPAYSGLVLRMNYQHVFEDMIGWVGYWDAILILAAVAAGGLAIRGLDRTSRGILPTAGVPGRSGASERELVDARRS